jgi:hypothetical protein
MNSVITLKHQSCTRQTPLRPHAQYGQAVISDMGSF